MTLVRPVSRSVFTAGKVLGVLVLSILNLFLLGIIFFVLFYIKLGEINFNIFPAFAFMIFCILLITLMGMLISFYMPRMAVPLINLFIYIMSIYNEIPYYFKDSWVPSKNNAFLNTVLPDFGELQFACASLITGVAPITDCLWPAFTIILYTIACWGLLIFVFRKRDV